MSSYIAEFLGTMILIWLGDGVVANVSLKGTKGKDSDWIVITLAWALAVAVPVYIFGGISGAHFNPAVTVANAVIGKFAWNKVTGYIIAQILGAMAGAVLVWLTYLPHFDKTEDKVTKLGVFAAIPAIRNFKCNFLTEFLVTGLLVFSLMGIGQAKMADGISAMVVGFVILVIGLGLGGPTGYAINPARDLGPRIAHAILPIKNKGNSDWSYAPIPIIAPFFGGIVGAVLFTVAF